MMDKELTELIQRWRNGTEECSGKVGYARGVDFAFLKAADELEAALEALNGALCRDSAGFVQERDALAAHVEVLRAALQYYADGDHFIIADDNAWDTVSGEPPNLWEDEANTATVEDGSIAKHAIALPDTAADILRARDF